MSQYDYEHGFDLMGILRGSWEPLEVGGAHFENHRSRVIGPGAAEGAGSCGWFL